MRGASEECFAWADTHGSTHIRSDVCKHTKGTRAPQLARAGRLGHLAFLALRAFLAAVDRDVALLAGIAQQVRGGLTGRGRGWPRDYRAYSLAIDADVGQIENRLGSPSFAQILSRVAGAPISPG